MQGVIPQVIDYKCPFLNHSTWFVWPIQFCSPKMFRCMVTHNFHPRVSQWLVSFSVGCWKRQHFVLFPRVPQRSSFHLTTLVVYLQCFNGNTRVKTSIAKTMHVHARGTPSSIGRCGEALWFGLLESGTNIIYTLWPNSKIK